jgi:hypothetical protein
MPRSVSRDNLSRSTVSSGRRTLETKDKVSSAAMPLPSAAAAPLKRSASAAVRDNTGRFVSSKAAKLEGAQGSGGPSGDPTHRALDTSKQPGSNAGVDGAAPADRGVRQGFSNAEVDDPLEQDLMASQAHLFEDASPSAAPGPGTPAEDRPRHKVHFTSSHWILP